MHPSLKIQAVILDLDGLIIDSEPIYRLAWQSAAADLGYELSDGLYLTLIGLNDRDSEEALIRAFGSEFPLAQFRKIWPVRWRRRVEASGIQVKPGLRDFLKVLDAHRLPSVIATSSDAEQAEMSLRAAGLKERFSSVVTGDQVPKGKPAPDIFWEAARWLDVAPPHCLVLEDSDAGILAAAAAEIPSLMIPDLKQPSEIAVRHALRVFSSLKEAAEFVEIYFKDDPFKPTPHNPKL